MTEKLKKIWTCEICTGMYKFHTTLELTNYSTVLGHWMVPSLFGGATMVTACSLVGDVKLCVTYSKHPGFDALLKKMGEIRDAKAHDYAADRDSLGNFSLSASVVGLPASTTVLVRMCDKLARIGSLVQKGKQEVKDESIQDTLLDMANYALIMILCLEREKPC